MATGNSIGDLFVRIKGDTTDFDKSVDKTKKGVDTFATGTTNIAKSLKTLIGGIGLAALALKIADIGKASIDAASDAEEATAKFNTAFKGIEDRAADVATSLKDSYGLSQTESEKLLGNTGDLLKGFGATADGALDFSYEIQKLSVDLASYNNVQGGASRVSNILTKSVLGNKDGLSELGVSLLDTDIKQELVRTGQEKLTGQAGKLAKAQATYNLILLQTKDAQSDFQRTQDGYANQMKIAKARTSDLSVELGRMLLPTATKGVGVFGNLTAGIVKHIKALNDAKDVYDKFAKGTETVNEKLFVVKKQIAENSVEIDKLELMYSRATDPKFKKKWQEQLTVLYEQNQVARRIESSIRLEIKAEQDLIDEQEKAKKAIEDKAEAEEKARKARQSAYIEQNEAVQQVLKDNESEIEAIDAKIEEISKLSLAESTYYDDQQEAIRLLQEEKQAILKQESEDKKAHLEMLQADEDAFLLEQDEKGKELQQKKLDRLAEEDQARKQAIADEISLRKDQAEQLLGIIANIQEIRLNAIEEDKNSQIDALDRKTLGEEEYAEQVKQIEYDAAVDSWKIQKEQLKLSKANSLIEIAINTAVGVSKALAQGGFLGIATGSLVTAAGVAQASAVLSQPEPAKPQLATGAIIAGSQRGVDVTVGEGGNGEIIQGMGSQGKALRQQLANETADVILARGGGGVTNNYYQSLFNTANPSDLRKFNRINRPYQVAEEQRIGARN